MVVGNITQKPFSTITLNIALAIIVIHILRTGVLSLYISAAVYMTLTVLIQNLSWRKRAISDIFG